MDKPWTYTDELGGVWTIDGSTASCSIPKHSAFVGVFGYVSAHAAPLPVVAELLRRAGYTVTEPQS